MRKCVLCLVFAAIFFKASLFVENWTSFNVDFDMSNILAYSDRDIVVKQDGVGYSKASFVNYSDSLRVEVSLRDGYIYPYAGVEIVLDESGHKDFSRFDFFEIVLRAKNIAQLNLHLKVEDQNFGGYRHLVRRIEVDESVRKYRLTLESFRTPLWWLEEHGNFETVPNGTRDILKRIKSIQIEATDLVDSNIDGVIVVEKIKVFSTGVAFAMRLAALLFLFFIGLLCFKRYKASSKDFSRSENVNLVDKQVTDYISNNYHKTDISIEKIALDTNLEEREIQEAIKKLFSSSLKAYVNSIRLEEAARLLKESDRNISELAYAVGFKNVSHFNRSFKIRYKCSPNEYRKNIDGATEI